MPLTWYVALLLMVFGAGSAAAAPTLVLVVGAEGSPEYGRQFGEWADRWSQAATRGSAQLVQVGRDAEGAGGTTDKDRLRQLLADEAKASATDPLWLVLIGHGTYDGREAKFNLRGPDVTDAELAEWVGPVKRPVAIINCASASAPFLKKLSGRDRIVVTATRSGSENNFARFGEHLSAAIADPAADLDRDGQTSLLEAFVAASGRVNEFYKSANRLATEHALLDDTGDGLGTPADWFRGTRATKTAKDGTPPDGTRAHRWHLVLSDVEQAMPPDARARRDALEAEVEALRARKAQLPEAEYYSQLEKLLLKLAAVYAAEKPETAAP